MSNTMGQRRGTKKSGKEPVGKTYRQPPIKVKRDPEALVGKVYRRPGLKRRGSK